MATTPTATKSKAFAIGDLVRVLDGTNDPMLPESRMGLVVEVVRSERQQSSRHKDLYNVQFGTKILCFHPMWLEHVT
jgi:hypothetical protein